MPKSVSGRLDRFLAARGVAELAPLPTATSPLEQLIPGKERRTALGPCYVITRHYAADQRHGDRDLGRVLARDSSHAALLAVDSDFTAFQAQNALYLDLETTGLSTSMGTLAFLIGAAHFRGDQLTLEQWLLRDPDEEASALTELATRMAEADALVTFNGRSFDLPFIRARFSALRLPDPSSNIPLHLDLLHASRRALGHSLPNCRLGTLESHCLGVHRVGDVPSAQIPKRYWGYLHGGSAADLVPVVEHNRIDILSMITLLDALLERAESAPSLMRRDPPSAFALAKAALKIGHLDWAESIFTAAVGFPASRARGAQGLRRVQRRRSSCKNKP